LVHALHSSAVGGHSGFHATYHSPTVCACMCHLPASQDRASLTRF
jgi:hypothetical protein